MIASVVLGVALVVALALWVNALTVPVVRAGAPTASVTPLPAPSTATGPAATPSTSGSGTASASPSGEPTAAPEPVEPTSSLPKLKSSGKFTTAGVNVAAGNSTGKLRRVSVQVETSLTLDPDKVGRQIAGVLNDPRSWAGSGNVRFAVVADPDKADLTIRLASLATARKACTPEPSTCLDGGDIVIDASFWIGGTPTDYPSRTQWQAYLVNHSVGHLLGEKDQTCSRKGAPAPVMMAQEGALAGCAPNPWPFP